MIIRSSFKSQLLNGITGEILEGNKYKPNYLFLFLNNDPLNQIDSYGLFSFSESLSTSFIVGIFNGVGGFSISMGFQLATKRLDDIDVKEAFITGLAGVGLGVGGAYAFKVANIATKGGAALASTEFMLQSYVAFSGGLAAGLLSGMAGGILIDMITD
jgi:hypothetical protein